MLAIFHRAWVLGAGSGFSKNQQRATGNFFSNQFFMKIKSLFLFVLIISFCSLKAQNRWNLESDGSISWTVQKGDVHSDNIEMSGRFISVIASYGVDEKGRPVLSRQLVFPMLRTIPNDTHANIIYTFGSDAAPAFQLKENSFHQPINLWQLKNSR
ncbi:MAG: hypothetical protein H6Q23_2173 [Bacteroidetes bacterium]|nr:hypothetical protein [Bacteroidota bacterium]